MLLKSQFFRIFWPFSPYRCFSIFSFIWVSFFLFSSVTATDYSSQGRSLAAGQVGLAHYYHMADDSFWKRSDDSRFSAYKDLNEPTADDGWWATTAYRSDVSPQYGRSSFSQDYSATFIGHESQTLMQRWHGTLRQGAFYMMTTSTASRGDYQGEKAYGGGSDSMKDYGGGFGLSWSNPKDQHVDAVLRLSQVQHNLSYADSSGKTGLSTYRTWLTSLGVRYYQTKLLKNQFFWEPQIGLSLAYVPSYTIDGRNLTYRNDDKFLIMPRLGLMAGKAYTINGHAGLAYGRIGLQGELNGGLHGTLATAGEDEYVAAGLKQDSWYDLTLGTSLTLGKGNKIWGELTRRSGEHLEPSWSVNGGLVLKWGGASHTVRERMKKLKADPRSLPLNKKKEICIGQTNGDKDDKISENK